MAKIMGIGNALTDILVHLPNDELLTELSLPKGGMTHIDRRQQAEIESALSRLPREMATGGSASNTIHALSVLGVQVGFIGVVGDDATGTFFRQKAESRGIDARLTVQPGAVSGTATALITPDGERTFATHLGAATLVGADVEPETFSGYDILHVEGYLVQNHLSIEHMLRAAKSAGLRVSYDLASWNIVAADLDFVRHIVETYVDIVFANEEEAAAFSRQSDPLQALDLLSSHAEVAVVKVGKRGAYGRRGDEQVHVPAVGHPRVVDTTAAGDFFAAGFLYGHIGGASLPSCMELGNRLAGEVIQVMGTQVADDRLRRAITL